MCLGHLSIIYLFNYREQDFPWGRFQSIGLARTIYCFANFPFENHEHFGSEGKLDPWAPSKLANVHGIFYLKIFAETTYGIQQNC